ncbi:MAG: lytic transglycosylase domain-containing protein [Candidatus Polarisedimenticolia bacterium]
MRLLGAAAACGALLLPPPVAAEEVRSRQVDGVTLFTMRPTRRPEAPTARVPEPGRRTAPPEIIELVEEASARHGLDPRLITTVISVESAFNPRAVSPKGARGLMQLMPQTARQYGVSDLNDPRENIEGGVAYLRDLTRRYKGDLRLALAAYNAGPEAVERASGVPNFRETREYLRKIEARYGVLASGGDPGSGGTRPFRARPARIRASQDENGETVYTNARGPGLRVVTKPR